MDAATGRVLGIDYGTKRVGVAMSDPMRVVSSGVGTWENDGKLLSRLAALVRQERISLIVVGMPYAPDGGTGGKGKEVEEFIRRLRGCVATPVDTWDESFTSADAQRALRESGLGRKKRRTKALVDEMAARILLQQYLEHHYDR